MLLRSNLKRYGGAGSNDNFTNTMADPWIPMISANFLGNHESVCASLKCKKCTTVKAALSQTISVDQWAPQNFDCYSKESPRFITTVHCISDQVTHNIGPWMCDNSSEIFRKKQSVRCVQRQSTILRLCHVFTHFASSVSTNTQTSQEDSYKRQSNVPFVRHLFKSPKETHSKTCPHLIISIDWWMFSL